MLILSFNNLSESDSAQSQGDMGNTITDEDNSGTQKKNSRKGFGRMDRDKRIAAARKGGLNSRSGKQK